MTHRAKESRKWQWHRASPLPSVGTRLNRIGRIRYVAILFSLVFLTPVAQSQVISTDAAALVVQTGHGDIPSDLIFDHRGTLAASLGQNGIIKIWDVTTGRTLRSYKSQRVIGMRPYVFSADDSSLAIGTTSGAIVLENLVTDRGIEISTGLSTWLTAIAASPDGKWMAAGDVYGNINLTALASSSKPVVLRTAETPDFSLPPEEYRKQLERLTRNQPYPTRFVFSAASDRLGVAFANGDLLIIDLTTTKGEVIKKLGDANVSALRFNAQNHLVAGIVRIDDRANIYTSGTLQVLDATADDLLINVRTARTGGVQLDEGASKAVLLCRNRDYLNEHETDMRIWRLAPLEELSVPAVLKSTEYETPFAVSNDGSKLMLFAGSHTDSLYALDLVSQKRDLIDVAPVQEITTLTILPERRIFAVGVNHSVGQWDLTTGEPSRFYAQMGQASYSADGQWVAYFGGDAHLHITERRTGGKDFISPFTSKGVGGIVILPGATGVLWNEDWGFGGAAKIWRIGDKEARQLCVSESGFGTMTPIAVSSSGRFVSASCSHVAIAESDVYVWNMADLSPKRHFSHVMGTVQSLSFSPDEESFAYTQGVLFLYDLSDDDDDDVTTIIAHKEEGKLVSAITRFLFRPDSKTIIVSAGTAYEPPDSVQTCVIATQMCRSLFTVSAGITSISGTERYTAVGQSNGVTTILDWQTESIVLQVLIAGTADWLAVTPDGLFDGTADAMRWVSWKTVRSLTVYPLETFYNNYFFPGLVADILEGARPKPLHGPIANLLSLPGTLAMVNAGHASISRQNGKIVLCIPEGERLESSSVSTVALFKAGERLDLSQVGFTENPQSTTCRYRKEVDDDGTQYEFVGREGTSVNNSLGKIDGPSPRHETRNLASTTLHVLTIGVSTYQNSPYRTLPYSVGDAIALDQYFLEQSSTHLFQSVHVWNSISDPVEKEKHGSKEEIKSQIAAMEGSVGENDIVLLFFSGHGKIPPGQEMFYFIPHFSLDFWNMSSFDERRIALGTPLLAEFVRKLRARRIVLVVDACESGGIAESMAKVADVKRRSEHRRSSLERVSAAEDVGVDVIAAAIPVEEAASTNAEKHGWLTTALLEALRGRGNSSGGDGTIWISDIVEYVNRRLPEIARTYGQSQTPSIQSVGVDFPLGFVSH